MKRILAIASAVLLLVLLLLYILFPPPDRAAGTGTLAEDLPGVTLVPTNLPSFDAEALAASETRMWQAYYGGDLQGLGTELVRLLQEQFGLGLKDSMAVAADLSAAALTFQKLTGNHEERVLPLLTRAYERLRSVTGGGWDAGAVARAELDWWVARRTPGGDGVDQVGRRIAVQYALLYGHSNAHIERAGLLRAEAARLRDNGGAWPRVRELLGESYRELVDGID